MALQLPVQSRDTRGKRRNRRLRRSGQIPAVLYGHGLENVALSVETESITAAIRHGSRLVSLTGAVGRVGLHPRSAMGHVWDAHRPRRLHANLGARDRRGPRARRTARRGPRRARGRRGRAVDPRSAHRVSGVGDSRASAREYQPSEAYRDDQADGVGVAGRGQDAGGRPGSRRSAVQHPGGVAGRRRGRGAWSSPK